MACPAFLVQVLDQLPGRVFLCSRQGAAHLDDAPRKRQALKWLKSIGVGSGGKYLGKTLRWLQCLLKCGELHAKHSGSKMFELCCVKQTRIHISHHITCFTEPAYDLILLQVRRMLAYSAVATAQLQNCRKPARGFGATLRHHDRGHWMCLSPPWLVTDRITISGHTSKYMIFWCCLWK